LPRKIHWIKKTSKHPKIRLCRTVWVVRAIKAERS
jgi:hypothetical protein